MKVLVIPDDHMKNLFGKAEEILEKLNTIEALLPENERQPLGVVFLGDLVDDWGQEENLKLYEEAFDNAIDFVKRNQDRYEVFFCIGNHDYSYVIGKKESGYSSHAEGIVRKRLKDLRAAFDDKSRFAFVHCIDNVIFSHAGISWRFVYKYADYNAMDRRAMIDDLIMRINERSDDIDPGNPIYNQTLMTLSKGKKINLWCDDSPIWVRMQKFTSLYFGDIRPYNDGRLQVVGHTPVERPLYEEEKNLLSLDTFSTNPDGSPIGDCRFVVVDTIEKSFQYADEIVDP